jgi:hypothetical protein
MDESNVTAMLPRTKDVMNTKGESTMSQSVYQMYWFLPGDDRVRTLGLGALMAATRALIAVHLPEGQPMPHCAACQRRFRRGETAGEVALLVPFAAEEADADEYMSAVICSKCADLPVMEKTEAAIASLREIMPIEIVKPSRA